MAPKKPPAAAAEEEPPEEEEPKPLPAVWVFGINDHLELPAKPPAGYQPSGDLLDDCADLCKRLQVVLHPTFKPKPKPEPVRSTLSLRDATTTSSHPAQADGTMNIRSTLLDQASVHILSMALPTVALVRMLTISDCRLDTEMLKLLRQGLQGECPVESLQIEWNPLELPLPADQVEGAAAASPSEASPASGEQEGGDAQFANAARLEALERHRYRLQSQRLLRSFGEWLTSLGEGSLETVWQTLSASVSPDAQLSKGAFHDVMEASLGLTGPPVAEAFEVLDGPDYAAGTGKVSVSALKAALEALPAEVEDADKADPVGLTLAEFVDGECCLESLSLRACALTRVELAPLTEALAKCPWQLRALNLWENRICDRGAELLAAAVEQYRGLEFLGLGRNRITDAGATRMCQPFQLVILDEAGKKAAEAAIKEQEGYVDGVAKAKAKAKAKAEPSPTQRVKRERSLVVDELEERPPATEGAETTWALRRQSELKVLALNDNPIRQLKTLEALQPLGPRGAELVLRGTPAAAQLLAKRPELATKEKKPFFPGGEGWLVRVN